MWFLIKQKLTVRENKVIRAKIELPALYKLDYVPRAFAMASDLQVKKAPLINFTIDGEPCTDTKEIAELQGTTALLKFKEKGIVITKPYRKATPTHFFCCFRVVADTKVFCNSSDYYCVKGYEESKRGYRNDIYYIAVPLDSSVFAYPDKLIYGSATPSKLRTIKTEVQEVQKTKTTMKRKIRDSNAEINVNYKSKRKIRR